MSWSFAIELLFNGLQLGLVLFLMAVGATLVFGVMNLVNLSHGSMFMLGGYLTVAVITSGAGWATSALAAIISVALIAAAVETGILRFLYHRSHLDQVLATFGLMLVFNEAVILIWGRESLYLSPPGMLSGTIEILPGVPYPTFRLAITVVALVLGLIIYLLISRTRLGMRIRAGAERRDIVELLGVNIRLLYTLVFCIGAMLAAVAGIMTAPLLPLQSGMGDPVLILALVVIVIGGIGSIRGAFAAALMLGVFDTCARYFFPLWLGPATGTSLASMAAYIVMAAVLLFRPRGLLSSA
jgi:branched-chain amino acid transport system permease protein